MILHVYGIRDERLNQYGTPIYTAGDEDAVRSDYEQSIRSLSSQIDALTPEPGKDSPDNQTWLRLIAAKAQLEDAVIYKLGDFDNLTGEHIMLADPVLLFRIKELF